MGNCNTCVLNDQDRMEDLLAQEKYLIGAYSTFIPEATCPELRTVLKDNFQDCVQNQYSIFEKMTQLGWYPTQNAPMQEVDAARQKFQQLKQRLG
ncbi:MAG: spore coat protein [Eubacteriales bacterium]|nr:spore coat protein [Eubacteriales bacterium]